MTKDSPSFPEVQAIVRAAVDMRYGDGTSQGLEDLREGLACQRDLQARWGISQSGTVRRVIAAKAYARRLLIVAGLVEPHTMVAA